MGLYDFIVEESINNVGFFNNTQLWSLILKLGIEMTNKNKEIILISFLKNGFIIENEIIFQKIINTKNKDIINCVYEHIEKILWSHENLIFFLKKNNLKMSDNILNLI